jgi:AraC-like DNA-binding protein
MPLADLVSRIACRVNLIPSQNGGILSMSNVDTMPGHSEIVHYDYPGVPLYIRKGLLSSFPGKRAQCHWHDDIELITILSGEMNYYANGTIILLHKGDSILINSRVMHYGYSSRNRECSFICILFNTSLLSPCRDIALQYISSLTSRQDLPCICFKSTDSSDIGKAILHIWDLKESGRPCYEMDVIGTLYSLWSEVKRESTDLKTMQLHEAPSDTLCLRKMVAYILEHYRESITLHDIADAGKISVSKCCSVFRQQTRQSPFEFLNTYRLRLSTDYLKSSDRSIADIAAVCGFNHQSYYSERFLSYYKITPRDYRKAAQSQSE